MFPRILVITALALGVSAAPGAAQENHGSKPAASAAKHPASDAKAAPKAEATPAATKNQQAAAAPAKPPKTEPDKSHGAEKKTPAAKTPAVDVKAEAGKQAEKQAEKAASAPTSHEGAKTEKSAAARHGEPATKSTSVPPQGAAKKDGNPLGSALARINQRIKETLDPSTEVAASPTPATAASAPLRAARPAASSPRIHLRWRVSVVWPTTVTGSDASSSPGRIGLSWP